MRGVEQQPGEYPLKVLVVDDDIPTRILLRVALTKWGYQIQEAADGEEAWQILQSSDRPELIISDWVMPKLDGLGLCERIKNELKNPPYIILLTQMSGTANIVKGLEAGADEFLAKPFNMAELRSRLSVGLRIIQYEKNIAAHPELSQISKKQILSLLRDNVKRLGGTLQESKDANTMHIVIEFPLTVNEEE